MRRFPFRKAHCPTTRIAWRNAISDVIVPPCVTRGSASDVSFAQHSRPEQYAARRTPIRAVVAVQFNDSRAERQRPLYCTRRRAVNSSTKGEARQSHLQRRDARVRRQLVPYQVRVVRRTDEVVGQRLRHILLARTTSWASPNRMHMHIHMRAHEYTHRQTYAQTGRARHTRTHAHARTHD